VAYARERKPFGKPLAANQAIQFPLVELQTQCEMLRALIHKTAWPPSSLAGTREWVS
jgi:alkylation response protein AidB-like acyl-CoA dehydrogenase